MTTRRVYSRAAKKWVTVIEGGPASSWSAGGPAQKFSLKDFQTEGPPSPKQSKRAYGRAKSWVRIPLEPGLKLAKQVKDPVLAVLLALDRAIFEDNGHNPVKFTNVLLNQFGISHASKIRVLHRLGAAGVVSVEWDEGTGAPMVTHHWHPRKP